MRMRPAWCQPASSNRPATPPLRADRLRRPVYVPELQLRGPLGWSCRTWYLCYALSYRDAEELLAERGVSAVVDAGLKRLGSIQVIGAGTRSGRTFAAATTNSA
jgi:hypothetical protein